MHSTLTQCIFLLSLLVITNCTPSIEEAKDFSQQKSEALYQIPTDDGDTVSIEDLMVERGLKGLSVAVFDDYEIIWAESFGVKSNSDPIDINTAFSTASISKAFTATLFAILEEEGLIELDVPVNNYLKRWQIPQTEFNQDIDVTLEHLLSHTAGTTQGGFIDFYEGDTIPTILESVKGEIPNSDHDEITLTFKPGTDWSYSGGGYTVAMMAVEDHLGKSLADLANEYLFAPLNLQYTTMKQPNEFGFPDNVAKAHDIDQNIVGTGIPITPQVSASGMWSNPTEMALLLIEIQKALNGIGSDIISEDVANRIMKVQYVKFLRDWSLGWERMYGFGNLDWFSHGGANTGTGGYVYATMTGGKGIVIFGNGPNQIRIPFIDILRDNIIRTHNWGSEREWVNQEEINPSDLPPLTGRYKDIDFDVEIEFIEEDGKLYLPMFIGGVRHNFIHIGDNAFITDNIPGGFKFIQSSEGMTVHYFRDTELISHPVFEKIED